MHRINSTAVWQAPDLPGTLFLRAQFKDHAFEPHFHEEYAIGIIDAGCQSFIYDQNRRLDMPRGTVALIAPGVVHTGWSGVEEGWCYRMLYPPAELMRDYGRDVFGTDALPTFHQPVVTDTRLFDLLSQLHDRTAEPFADPLEIQGLYIAIVASALTRHAGCIAVQEGTMDRRRLAHIRELLNDQYQSSFELADLAAVAGMNRFKLLRQFRSAYGVSPHAYLRLCRVRRAREAILKGATLADTAFDVGFADQAHMTRAFRRTLGFTPGELQKSRL